MLRCLFVLGAGLGYSNKETLSFIMCSHYGNCNKFLLGVEVWEDLGNCLSYFRGFVPEAFSDVNRSTSGEVESSLTS